MLTAKEISKNYGTHQILIDVSLSIVPGKRTTLVGANGVGKSTLLRIIAGLEEADSGEVEMKKETLLAYLPQELSANDSGTISEYLRCVTGISELEQKLENLASRLADPKLAADYSEAEEVFSRLDGYQFDHRMKGVLAGLGLAGIPVERRVSELSGGQRSKIALAGVLLRGVDILLLDEPTNNLDLPALIWLEEYIKSSRAGILMVSHDRKFVDRVSDRVCEIDWRTHGLSCMKGGYSAFLEQKRKLLESQIAAYNQQQDEIKRMEDSARDKKQWALMGARQSITDNDKFARGAKRDWSSRLASKAKSIEQQLDRMERIERPVERQPLQIDIRAADLGLSLEISLNDVVYRVSDKFTLGPISITINPGSRIGLVGLNGSGKTTLLRLISGDIEPTTGKVTVGAGVRFGHLRQYHENLPPNQTVLDFMRSQTDMEEQFLYNLLARFHFREGDAKKEISLLSPGGRARLLLASFSAIGVNTLLLDEPTNHLDVEGIEAVEDVLKTFEGTVIVVSHDRWFMERSSLTDLFLMAGGQISRLPEMEAYERQTEADAKKMLRLL